MSAARIIRAVVAAVGVLALTAALVGAAAVLYWSARALHFLLVAFAGGAAL